MLRHTRASPVACSVALVASAAFGVGCGGDGTGAGESGGGGPLTAAPDTESGGGGTSPSGTSGGSTGAASATTATASSGASTGTTGGDTGPDGCDAPELPCGADCCDPSELVELPIEVFGPEGASATRTLRLDAAAARDGAYLALRVNNLGYEGKGSRQLNGGEVVVFDHASVEVEPDALARGGMAHGGMNTLWIRVPLEPGALREGGEYADAAV